MSLFRKLLLYYYLFSRNIIEKKGEISVLKKIASFLGLLIVFGMFNFYHSQSAFASSIQACDNDPSSAYACHTYSYDTWSHLYYSGDYNGDDELSAANASGTSEYQWVYNYIAPTTWNLQVWLANPNFTNREARYYSASPGDLYDSYVGSTNQYSDRSGWNYIGYNYFGGTHAYVSVSGVDWNGTVNGTRTGADMIELYN